MDFKNANELLALCEEKNLPISEIMRIREIELGETASEIVNKKMTRVLGIMKDAAFSPIRQPVKSMGGLIGGEARKLSLHAQEKKGLCGNLLQKAITYAMATLETNASCLSTIKQKDFLTEIPGYWLHSSAILPQ